MAKEKRGGYRENAGRKKSDIETTTIAWRVPKDCSEELKQLLQPIIVKFLKKADKKRW